MIALNARFMKKFIDLASQKLAGEWLLIGGTLLPALGLEIRSTVDIDFVGLGDKERQQNLELMGLADQLGLPVETINQAASFFVHKIGYSKSDLILIKKSKKASIYRPSFELYFKLKAARLTESDLTDIQHYYRYCMDQKDDIQIAQIRKHLSELMKNEVTPEKSERLKKLKEL